MKTGADMKTVECLEKVEKFLKMCNKLAVAHYFDIRFVAVKVHILVQSNQK